MNSSVRSEGTDHPKAETLAAFIDGRLARKERREMVEHLDACPDCYEEYAEILRFLQDEEPAGQVVVIGREDRPRSLRPFFWTAAAIAAVLVAAVVVPGVLRETIPAAGLPTAQLASALASPDRAADQIVSRPAIGSLPGFGPRGASYFETGVATVDLRVAIAVRSRDRALAPASVLAPPSSALVSAVENERWSDASRELHAIERSLSEGAGADGFLAGARAEAGRLAAASGDSEFFGTEPGRAAYEALGERLGEDLPPPDDLEALGKEFDQWVRDP